MSEYFRFKDLDDKSKRELARSWKAEAAENGDPDWTEDEWLDRLEGGMIDSMAGRGDDDEEKEGSLRMKTPLLDAIQRSVKEK